MNAAEHGSRPPTVPELEQAISDHGFTLVDDDDLPVRGLTDWTRRTVSVDPRMYVRERRSTLQHELVHLERGPFPRWAIEREEATVRALAAERLLPFPLLLDAIRGADSLESAAEALEVSLGDVTTRLAGLSGAEGRQLDRALPSGEAVVRPLGRRGGLRRRKRLHPA